MTTFLILVAITVVVMLAIGLAAWALCHAAKRGDEIQRDRRKGQ